MKKIISILFTVLVVFTTGIQAQNDIILAREPGISPDGSAISFSYQGDIWTIPFAGGEAKRLTIHEAYESHPTWSPDGSTIAFEGGRFGNTDIFTIPAKGGKSKRLTFYSGSDNLSDWTTQNSILFSSNRTFQQVEWDSELQHVSAGGGTPSRLMDALGDMPVMSPNGRYIAFVRGSCRISREQYDGPADKDIWIYDTEDESFTEITTNSRNDFLPRWSDNQTLHFISAASGRYNIVTQKINADGSANGETIAVTNFNNDGVRHFDVANNGRIVFERKTDLFTMANPSASAQKLNISLSSDYRFDPEENMTFNSNISDYAVSPNGKYTAMTIRGEIFIKSNDEKSEKAVNISDHAYRDQSPTWLNDSTLVFTSDRNGQYDLYMVDSSDPNKTDIFKTLKHKITRITNTDADEINPQISPDGTKIAYRQGRGTLITADIDENGNLSNETVLLDGWSTPGGVTWSPDSKWLAYSLDDLNFNSEVYIHAADGSKEPVNVTMHPRGDYGPVWSRDGSKLGFVSNRNNGDNDLWFVWLKEEDWLKSEEDREEGYYFAEEEKESDEKKDEEEKKEVEPIQIDFEDIHERLWQVTSMPGGEGNMVISQDGETFYFTAGTPAARGSDLFSVQFDRSEMKQLTEGGRSPYGVTLGPDGKTLYAISSGRFNQVDPSSGKFTALPFNARMVVNHDKENEQVFEEAWSALNQGFYDPEFHGKNWNALKKKYKPWTLAASTSQDFRYMFNWMLGQLNASHMGLYGSNPEETQDEDTGLLGIAVEPVDDGVRVTNVVMNSPADKEQSKLYEGDIITKVEGKEITPGTNFFSYLVNDISEQVLLEVEGTDGETREVVIRPTNSLGDELYEEWIDSREQLVKEYSNDRLGYIHIEGMNWPSFERFERELMAQGHDKEGIVIDVRWNGGGWTTDMLMTVLNVRQHAYTVPRGATEDLDENHEKYREYYPFGERLPLSWWTKPSVTLANESSYSNAEIFSHAFKTLGIGKLVGMPTFGAVISTGGMGLMDGSFVRMPFRAWYVKATDKNMENGPAYPDVQVNNAPDSKAKGEDPQLKKAVEVLLEQIEQE
ncbi:MAG: S41 family peptidase [Balneolaceae bacterium]|nr:S41 family peptidase [Balneolaceae bacterium]